MLDKNYLMISSVEEKSFFTQNVKIKKIFSNKELRLYNLFVSQTDIYPNNIIIRNPFTFFFVNNENYFKAKRFLKSIRARLLGKKVLIIRDEVTLINLLFSFFPDTYIHDVQLGLIENTGKRIIKLKFLFYEDRGIAIGRNGDYIKIVNDIFEKYVELDVPIEIKCDLINLYKADDLTNAF